jgi:hypothetical protein
VFKKIVKSPIFKAVAVAAAIYFTGGLAAGAMGSTFAATLPGVGALAEGLGITAGAFGATASAAASAAGIGAGFGLGGFTAATEATLAGGSVLGGAGSAAAGLAAAATEGSELVGAAGMLTPGTGLAGEAAGGLASGGIAGTASPAAASTNWFGGMSKGAQSFFDSSLGQKMMFKGLEMGAKGVMSGFAAKAREDELEQQRADKERLGRAVDLTNVFSPKYKTPGVIASAIKLPEPGAA